LSVLDRIRGDEDGAVAVIVALLTVLVFVPMMALVADGGRLYVERSATQNAADHAALAAAWAGCNGRPPVPAGMSSASRNGYDNGTTNTVTVEAIGGGWRATVQAQVDGAFAGAIGVTDLTVRSRATARCTPGTSGGAAIFAHGTCPKGIDLSGSTTTINGAVHSNRDIDVGGSGYVVNTGPVTYVNNVIPTLPLAGSKMTWPAPTKVASRPFPLTFDIAAYRPGGTFSTAPLVYVSTTSKIDDGWLSSNGYLVGKNLKTGIYYSTQNIELGTSELTGQATFVSETLVKIGGGGTKLTPYHQNVLAFSNRSASCGNAGIELSGSSANWRGILYAPTSLAVVAGSSNSQYQGSILAKEVRLSGSNLTITWDGSGPPSVPFAGLTD
jgi:Flp pilus assembly protein TadG